MQIFNIFDRFWYCRVKQFVFACLHEKSLKNAKKRIAPNRPNFGSKFFFIVEIMINFCLPISTIIFKKSLQNVLRISILVKMKIFDQLCCFMQKIHQHKRFWKNNFAWKKIVFCSQMIIKHNKSILLVIWYTSANIQYFWPILILQGKTICVCMFARKIIEKCQKTNCTKSTKLWL